MAVSLVLVVDHVRGVGDLAVQFLHQAIDAVELLEFIGAFDPRLDGLDGTEQSGATRRVVGAFYCPGVAILFSAWGPFPLGEGGNAAPLYQPS